MKSTIEKEATKLTKGQVFIEEWKKRKALREAESFAFAQTSRFKEIMEELKKKNIADGLVPKL